MGKQRMALLPLVLATLFVAGCGRKASEQDESTSARPQAPAETARDACTLLTVEDVAAAYGSAVASKSASEGSGYSSCEFTDPAQSNMFVAGIEVYWGGGREQWKILQLGTAAGTRVLEHQEKDVDVKSILNVGAVPGLGDQAVFSPLMGGNVLVGDRLVNFKFGLMPEPDKNFRPLAEKVVARL
jgi:Protein of unknown function (DUF3558)